jgi:hypothetical protein
MVGAPKGTFEYGRLIYLNAVEVSVRNVGTVTASGIQVTATLPNGEKQQLSGPTELEKNRTAVYRASTSIAIVNAREIEASITCSNCRK